MGIAVEGKQEEQNLNFHVIHRASFRIHVSHRPFFITSFQHYNYFTQNINLDFGSLLHLPM